MDVEKSNSKKKVIIKKKKKIPIPKVIKLSGVSFCKDNVNKLTKGQELKMELDPENKYDSNAIKVLNLDGDMCGFIPKKYKFNNDEFILNVLIKKKFDKLSTKFNLKVHEIYKWDGPTGLEVSFIQK
jgi:hypothetical protein